MKKQYGYAWITCEKGLIRYNPSSGDVKIYDADKNIKANKIRHIAIQNSNVIWVSSSGNSLYKLILR
ncbi:MAG: hypothetical protein B6I20_09890 [Bacteroidetes bacterium 4572_117]|nr:MAG: hypothetical protein B6I20_09890 [Bacteroidetes bacterium 4572_117]